MLRRMPDPRRQVEHSLWALAKKPGAPDKYWHQYCMMIVQATR